MAEAAKFFAPLPARAIGDDRLTGLHMKALAAVAMHDRLNRNGQGCWAGQKRLAAEICCNYSNLSTALRDLVKWDYLEKHKHPVDGRLTAFTVIYTDADKALVKGEHSLPIDKQPTSPKVCPETNNPHEIVCPEGRDSLPADLPSHSNNKDSAPLRKKINAGEPTKRNTPEGASPNGDRQAGNWDELDDGAKLGIIERALKNGTEELDLSKMLTILEDIGDAHEGIKDDPLAGWAYRLYEEVSAFCDGGR